MSRAYFRDDIVIPGLGPAANATVRVRQPGTSTPIVDDIFAGDTGGTTLSNPITAGPNGRVLFYLNTPQRVDLYIEGAGMAPTTIENEPVLPAPADLVTLATSQTLSNKTLSSPSLNNPTMTGGSWSGGAISTTTFTDPVMNDAILNDPILNDAAINGGFVPYPNKFGVGTGYSGVGSGVAPNSDVGFYGDDASQFKTQTDMLYVNRSVTVPSDVSTLRVYAQQAVGDSNNRPLEVHMLAIAGTTAYQKLGIELTVQGTYPGNGVDALVGMHVRSLSTTWGIVGGQRMDTGVLVGKDTDGWEWGFGYYQKVSEGSGRLFGAKKDGEVMAAYRLYSTGVGGHRVGMLNPSGVLASETWGGMWYDASAERLVIEAVTQGTGWRDVWISKNAGTLRVGANGYPIHRAPLIGICSGNLTLTPAPTDISGAAVALDRIGKWRITGTFALFGTGDTGQILAGALALTGGTGSATGGSAFQTITDGQWEMCSQAWIVTVTAITVTAKLQGSKNAGAGTSVVAAGSTNIAAEWMGEQ